MKKTLLLCMLLGILGTVILYRMDSLPLSFLQSSTAEAEVTGVGKAHYLALDPPFIVNFTHQGNLRYLQVSMEVMYPEEGMLDRIEERMPAIRNDLILLLSDQDFESLSTLAGKENLRHEIMFAINTLIHNPEVTAGSEESGEIYFTNFVMQ